MGVNTTMSQPYGPVSNNVEPPVPNNPQSDDGDESKSNKPGQQESGQLLYQEASVSVELSAKMEAGVNPDTGRMFLEKQVRMEAAAQFTEVRKPGPAPSPPAEDEGEFFKPEAMAQRLAKFTDQLFEQTQKTLGGNAESSSDQAEPAGEDEQSGDRSDFLDQLMPGIESGFEKARERLGDAMTESMSEDFDRLEEMMNDMLKVFDQPDLFDRMLEEGPGETDPDETNPPDEPGEPDGSSGENNEGLTPSPEARVVEQNNRAADSPNTPVSNLLG